jgi:hypothetical protein
MGAKPACSGFGGMAKPLLSRQFAHGSSHHPAPAGRMLGDGMEFGDFGWRDAALLAAVLAAVYLVVALLGLARLRRPREPQGDTAVLAAAPRAEAVAGEAVAGEAATPAEAIPAGGFAAVLEERVAQGTLEEEVGQLRAEVTALREELAELKTTRRVSPLYAEAAALAQRGFDARGVAEECGISVAEAELVLALSRENRDFDSEVDDGDGRGA